MNRRAKTNKTLQLGGDEQEKYYNALSYNEKKALKEKYCSPSTWPNLEDQNGKQEFNDYRLELFERELNSINITLIDYDGEKVPVRTVPCALQKRGYYTSAQVEYEIEDLIVICSLIRQNCLKEKSPRRKNLVPAKERTFKAYNPIDNNRDIFQRGRTIGNNTILMEPLYASNYATIPARMSREYLRGEKREIIRKKTVKTVSL